MEKFSIFNEKCVCVCVCIRKNLIKGKWAKRKYYVFRTDHTFTSFCTFYIKTDGMDVLSHKSYSFLTFFPLSFSRIILTSCIFSYFYIDFCELYKLRPFNLNIFCIQILYFRNDFSFYSCSYFKPNLTHQKPR